MSLYPPNRARSRFSFPYSLNIAAALDERDAITYEKIFARYTSAIRRWDVFTEEWTIVFADTSWPEIQAGAAERRI